jgi:prevent-host-death family protein
MTLREEIQPGQLAELLKRVQAGDEVVLTQDQKPVAKLVAAELLQDSPPRKPFTFRAITGHKVLTPNITGAEIAEDMFGQR